MISRKHRKILPTKSLQTASTASTDEEDNEDFTDLICRSRRVRFLLPPKECNGLVDNSFGDDDAETDNEPFDRSTLWYSKTEVASHRRDVKRTIRLLRSPTHCRLGRADILLTSPCHSCKGITTSSDCGSGGVVGTVASNSFDHSECRCPSLLSEKFDMDGEEICFRGCERYYSLETRFMTQKLVVEAVLEAQKEPGTNQELLRKISEAFSQAGKDLAVWHATLNSFNCYGFSGLKLQNRPSAPSRKDASTNKRFEGVRHSLSNLSLSDNEDEEHVRQQIKIPAVTSTHPPARHRHHRRAQSVLPPTPYIYAPSAASMALATAP